MSIISAQCDKLRKAAQTCRDLGRYETEQMLLDAADTIWELRDDLQQANAENARLRSELESVGTAAYLYGRGDLQAENAKLRKLAHKMWKPFCWAQSGYEVCLSDEEDKEIRDLARELRIEED